MHFIIDRFLLLPIGAVIALVWANTAAESYYTFSLPMTFIVNNVLMALFFGFVTQEIVEAVMPGGALHTWRRWTMAFAAAAGGILGAALTYVAYVRWSYEMVLAPAWPVACAIDIAAGYFVLRLVFHRTPALPFLLLLAIATDAFALVVVGLQQPGLVTRPGSAALMLLALGVAMLLRSRKVRAFWPYLAVCGTLSWLAFYSSGIHPALALVPIVPFLPHEPRSLDLFADQPFDPHDRTRWSEHEWDYAVQIVLFLFGLVNAGVILRMYGTSTWALLAAMLVGRPAGILLAVGIAVALGLHLPAKLGIRELIVTAFATSAGFTFALFVATGVFAVGPLLAEAKIGALATVAGAAIAIGAARLLHVGRFAYHPPQS